MSRIFKTPSTTKADTADELSQLGAAIERIADNRQNAEQELSTIDTEIAEALIHDADGSFSEAGKLEQRKIDLKRTIAQAALVLPRLEARRLRALEANRMLSAATHLEAAGRAYDSLKATLATTLAANDAAARAFAAAQADLGDAVSRDVPRVTFLPISESAITYWSAAIEEALGRRPRKTLVPPTGIAVRITSHNVRAFGLGAAATYTLGDVASFSAAEADRLCRSGAAVPVDERDRSRFQLDPREVAPPEPVDGRIQVMFGSPGRGPDGSAYSHGDIALFDAPVATRFVRSGVAEFLHPVRLDADRTDFLRES